MLAVDYFEMDLLVSVGGVYHLFHFNPNAALRESESSTYYYGYERGKVMINSQSWHGDWSR